MRIRVDEGTTERGPVVDAMIACADTDFPPGGTHSDDSDPVAPSFRWAIVNPVRALDRPDMGPWKASTRKEEEAAAAKNPASAIRSFMVRLLLGVLRPIRIGDC
jgi:hypothetical protein